MKDINGKDIIRFAVREQLMSYFKGEGVVRMFRNLQAIQTERYEVERATNRNGRQFRYIERENSVRQPRRINLYGMPLVELSKAPDTITMNVMLKTSSSAAQELAKDIRHTANMYIPGAKLEEKELTNQAQVDEMFSKEYLDRVVASYFESSGHYHYPPEPDEAMPRFTQVYDTMDDFLAQRWADMVSVPVRPPVSINPGGINYFYEEWSDALTSSGSDE